MTTTLNSNNISSLIAAAATSTEDLKLLHTKDDLESIQHPKIKKFLKTYHSSSQKSILGPNSLNISNEYVAAAALQQQLHQQIQQQQQQQQHRKFTETSNFDSDDWLAPPPNSMIKGCIALASSNDNNENTERCETLLHGERITCFIVGGEKRLCLPQMLNYVLKDFSVHEINTVCEKLHIYCSRCTQEQLTALKINNILPPSAPSCGLITLSDAERLCHKLMSTYISKHKKSVMLNDDQQENRVQLKVYHCCFGRAYGIIHPHLYNNQNAQCIECETCHLLFSPQNFVVHAHRNDESRICHWGFDSNNWRLYIKLVDSCRDENKYKLEFETFKNKFSHKRKSVNNDETTTTNGGGVYKNSTTDLHHTSTGSLFKKILKTSVEDDLIIHKSTPGVDHHHQQHHLMNTEHKLLNDLLSKPITNSTSSTTTNNSAINLYPAAAAQLINPKLLLHRNDKVPKYIDDYPLKNNHNPDDAAIEILFDNLQNEIDGNIKINENRERLINYLMRIKAAYNENLIKFVKNRLELQESKHNIELENEILKSRIKYLELDNQFLRNQLNKTTTTVSPSSSSSIPYLKYNHHHNQQQQQQDETTTATDGSTTSTKEECLNIDNAGSPQQQAAAIALIALHSPPSLTSTPKKTSQLQSKSCSVSPNSTSSSSSISNNSFNIKCEQVTP